MPIPDPAKPFEGNRTVNAKHAADFGEYWRANERWATPPLLLDTTYPLAKDFEPRANVAGVEFGIVRLPHNSAKELQILDGQHRILGWAIVGNRIAEELRVARERAIRAREGGDPVSIQVAGADVARLVALQERLRREYVTVEVLEGVTLEDHKQYFHDIAVNAKGITKSLTTSFDRRKVVNRVAMALAGQHPLLTGMVDFEVDRVAGRNENFISGRNLSDLIRTVVVGVGGAFTPRKEDALKEASVQQMVEQFFDAIVDSFPELAKVASGDFNPVDLREQTLLGSPTVLRVLAGAYHNLAVDKRDEENPYISSQGEKRALALFAQLSGHMGLPIEPGWFDSGYFPERTSKAPSSRSQDLKGLTATVTRWGESGTAFANSETSTGVAGAADAWI